MHTIKPLDKDILKTIDSDKLVFTVEEHSIIGGLGGAVSEFYASQKSSPQIICIGVNDEFLNPGEQQYVRRISGLDSIGIADKIIEAMS